MIDVQASIVVRAGIGGVYGRIEIDRKRRVQIPDGASLIDVPLVSKIDAPLEGVRAAQVGHVVCELIRGQETRIAVIVLQRHLHTKRVIEIVTKWMREKVNRWIGGSILVRVGEVEAESVHADNKLVQHVGIDDPTPCDCQIPWCAESVHDIRKSGEDG